MLIASNCGNGTNQQTSFGDLNRNDVLDPRLTISDIFEGDIPQKGRTHIIIKIPGSEIT
jgi:hypothetical protein